MTLRCTICDHTPERCHCEYPQFAGRVDRYSPALHVQQFGRGNRKARTFHGVRAYNSASAWLNTGPAVRLVGVACEKRGPVWAVVTQWFEQVWSYGLTGAVLIGMVELITEDRDEAHRHRAMFEAELGRLKGKAS